MNVSAYSIKNPLVATLVFALLTVVGIVAFNKMQVQQYPDVDFPIVVVNVGLPGAAADQLENDLALPIENKLAGIDGLEHLRTTLTTGNVSILAEFALEKDTNEALDDVRAAVGEVQGDLPDAASDPLVAKISVVGFPVATYTVSAPNMSASELSWFIDDTVAREIEGISGVGELAQIGGVTRIIEVNPNPNTLNALGMSLADLSKQLFANTQELSGGEAHLGGQTQTIKILGNEGDVNALAARSIATPKGVRRLDALAQIDDTQDTPKSVAHLGNESVIAFDVSRAQGASEVELVEAIDKAVAALNADNPAIHIQKVFDRSVPIHENYDASVRMLIEGAVLAVLVILVFLRNMRATFLAAVALPLSILPTFMVMYFFDFSLNMISLLALSLVIGVLVDDAIVEIENIMRHLSLGKTPYQAAMEAADEIGLAVVATTMTLVAVFLPTAFMSGTVGQFFRQFGWTAAIAVIMSLLVARLVTPMMAAYLMKPIKAHKETVSKSMVGYLNAVRWTLGHRGITLGTTLALFVGSLMMVPLLDTAFIPENDADQTRVQLTLGGNATIEDSARIGRLSIARIEHIEGIDQILSLATKSKNILDIALLPRSQRAHKSVIEDDIVRALGDLPGVQVQTGVEDGPPSGYSFTLTAQNGALLTQATTEMMDAIRALPMVQDVISDQSLTQTQIAVTPDWTQMARLGVTGAGLADTLRVATVGDYDQRLPKLGLDTRQVPIKVRLSKEDRGNIDLLKNLTIREGIKVMDVADMSLVGAQSSVTRFDRARAITLTVNSDAPTSEVAAAVKALPIIQNLPAGMELLDQGEAESMAELLEGFLLAMGVGIFCIFAVLVLLLHKVLQPLTILVALPLSVGGAFIGLLMTGSSLSMPSMIGFVMLMGIATKNSILLVDYAIVAQRDFALTRTQAILDACQKRARPIIMTTIAMAAGMLPLLLGLGAADASFRKPMAAAVLGGLITSTFLSLVVIPVVYSVMEDVSLWFKKRLL